jgi:hypothetical protein
VPLAQHQPVASPLHNTGGDQSPQRVVDSGLAGADERRHAADGIFHGLDKHSGKRGVNLEHEDVDQDNITRVADGRRHHETPADRRGPGPAAARYCGTSRQCAPTARADRMSAFKPKRTMDIRPPNVASGCIVSMRDCIGPCGT